MKLSVIILCVCMLVAASFLILGIMYYSSMNTLNMFENMTSDLFSKYNVSNEMRDYYNSIVITPIKNMVNLTFILLSIILILCILILIVEAMATK
jgi:beta-lactamase regulating signal transducer with metallopeptidase domain